MKRWMIATSLLLLTLFVKAQSAPNITWTKTFGGSGMDWGYYAQQTNDGGYITIGRIDRGSSNMDAWLIKTDANGDTLWTKTYGSNYIDEAYVVKQTSDGGYILAGASTAFGWYGEGWLIRTDSNGNIIWNYGYHPNPTGPTEWDNFYDVLETSDGGFVALGFGGFQDYYWQAWILKVNSNGIEIWNKSFGEQYWWERLTSFKQTTDGGFIAVGDKHVTYGDTTSHDGYLVKFNSNGDTLWTNHYGGTQVDLFRSIQITPEGDYIISGEREPYWAAGMRGWMVKTDEVGNVIWNNMYGDGGLMAVQVTPNGNYIAAGTKFTGQTNLYDGWIIKTDVNGNVTWEKLHAATSYDDVFQSIQPTSDGGYILGGRGNSIGSVSQIMLVKVEADESLTLTSFFENFDAVTPTSLPNNWSGCVKVLISNSVAEVKSMEVGIAPSLPNAVFVMNGIDGSNGQRDTNAFVALVSPLVQIGTSGAELIFKATGGNNVIVGTMSDPNDSSTFIPVQEISLTYNFEQYIVELNSPGETHIAFKHKNTNAVTPLFIDDISFDQNVPVELISFTATINKNMVVLNWLTVTETNNYGFEVERYIDSWEKIGFVPGFGTSTESHQYSFNDNSLKSGKYSYRLKQIDLNGNYHYSNTIEVIIEVPVDYSLSQNYPNPFNPSTTINFSIPVDAQVTIKVFNALGEEIRTLTENNLSAGSHSLNFNGDELVSGLYIYSINAQGIDNSSFQSVKKMMLLK